MDDIQEGLRYTFQTDSKYTLLVTGTGEYTASNEFSPALQGAPDAMLRGGTWA